MARTKKSIVAFNMVPLTAAQGVLDYYRSIQTAFYAGVGKGGVKSDTGSVCEPSPWKVTGIVSPYLHVHVIVSNSTFGQVGKLRKHSHLG
jgi:hypothetical protein